MVASKASAALRDPDASPREKSLAASVLSQTEPPEMMEDDPDATPSSALFVREYQHRGADSRELRATVMADEKRAEIELGGPAQRESRFVGERGERVRFTWALAAKPVSM